MSRLHTELELCLARPQDEPLLARHLLRLFPQLCATPHQTPAAFAEIDLEAFEDPEADLLAFDRIVHQAEDRAREQRGALRVRLRGHETKGALTAATQVLTRYQRLFPRRNLASSSARFDAVLERHEELHDRSKPLVRADYEHTRDVWQWVLRLAPAASIELQIAALFHDIERIGSEADVRIEHRAASYEAFKVRHAQKGAEIVRASLGGTGLQARLIDRVAQLVARHERPEEDPELRVLNDADALSFFALNSAGFLHYFGSAHTRKKVLYTLNRMRRRTRSTLHELKLVPEVAAMLDEGMRVLHRHTA